MACEINTSTKVRIITYILFSIISRSISADVRLVNEFGSSTYKGRVEVLYADAWGTVCDDGWDILDADVVCRQLGFTGAIRALKRAYFGTGQNLIWMDQVNCRGTEERIQDCPSAGWGTHDCVHLEDASVECSNASVRMTEGPDRYEGNIQLLHDGSWSYVCDDGWDYDDARVACKQLDNRGADAARNGSHYGVDSGQLLITDMQCTGTEAKLEQCQSSGWSLNNSYCTKYDKAGVSCTRDEIEEGAVRLVGTGNQYKGRVEIYHNGEWGTVCDDYWDYYDAKVVCRQLGYTDYQAKAYYNAYFGQGQGRIWLDNVACYGSEARLEDCLVTSSGWGAHDCYHGEDAGVYCDLKGEFDGAEIAGIVLGSLLGLSILLCCIKFIFCEAGANKRYHRRRRGRTQRNRPTTTSTATPEEHFEVHFNRAYTISGEQTEIITPEGFLRPPPFPEAQPPPFSSNELPPTYEFVLANPVKNGNFVPPVAGSVSSSNTGDIAQSPQATLPGAAAVLPGEPGGASNFPTEASLDMPTSDPKHAVVPEQFVATNAPAMPPVESTVPFPPQSPVATPYPPLGQTLPDSKRTTDRQETNNQSQEYEEIRDTAKVQCVSNALEKTQDVHPPPEAQNNPPENNAGVNLGFEDDHQFSDV